jgi:hypothetical protein
VGINVLFCEGMVMRKYLTLLVFLSSRSGDAHGGALATGTEYEINAKRQMAS